VKTRPGKILICGDFNARSISWGCRTGNRRGILLEEWMGELDLGIINIGNTPTCVRPQGTSVVDLTIGSSWVVSRVKEWKVEDMETLSDHLYIVFEIRTGFITLTREAPTLRVTDFIETW